MTKNTIRNIADKIKITDWKYLEQMNANDAYTEFENALNNIINSIAPEKTIKHTFINCNKRPMDDSRPRNFISDTYKITQEKNW